MCRIPLTICRAVILILLLPRSTGELWGWWEGHGGGRHAFRFDVRHWEKLWRVNGMQRALRIEEEAEARECVSLLR